MVRGMGSCVSYPPADAGRRGLRDAAVGVDAPGILPASERTTARLRVELRRRQSSGARMVNDFHLPPPASHAWARRRRMARTFFPQTDPQLHLVGKP